MKQLNVESSHWEPQNIRLPVSCAPLAAAHTAQYLFGVLRPVIFIVFKTNQIDSVIKLFSR